MHFTTFSTIHLPVFSILIVLCELVFFLSWCAFNLIYSLFNAQRCEGYRTTAMTPLVTLNGSHTLFRCYKFYVDYVYCGCHKSETKCTYSVTQFNDAIFRMNVCLCVWANVCWSLWCGLVFKPNVNIHDGNTLEKLQAIISFGMLAKIIPPKSNKRTHIHTHTQMLSKNMSRANTKFIVTRILGRHCIMAFFYSFAGFLNVQTKVSFVLYVWVWARECFLFFQWTTSKTPNSWNENESTMNT